MAKKMNFGGLSRQQENSRATINANSAVSGSNSKVFDTKVFGDVSFFKFENDKTYTVKFVPYAVDKTHPMVQLGKMEEGDGAYVFDYTQHNIGPNHVSVVCPKGTYKHSCPICDRSFDLRAEDPDSEEAKALKSSRRVIYNAVIIEDDPTKVQLIDTSHYRFEKELQVELDKGDEDGNPYDIADLCVGTGGKDLALRIKTAEETFGKNKYVGFTFKIVKNKTELDEDALLDQAVPLHKAVVELSAKELEEILYGAGDDEESEEPEEEEEDVVPVIKKASNIAEDEDDEEEEEKPAPKKAKAADECPHGFDWGVDTGMEDPCDDCKLYSACREAKKARKAAAAAKAED